MTDLNPYEFLLLVVESAYNTAKTSPVLGTDSLYIRLAGANRFTMRPKPTMRKIKFGGGFDAAGYAVSDQVVTTGELSVELCYSQAALLLGWANTRINSGQTVPWTTTEPIGDLASMSVYHGTAYPSTGAVRRRLYGGTKVTSWRLTSNAKDGVTMLKLGLRSSGPLADPSSGTFAAPADTDFPTDPVMFYQSSGAASVGGSALSFLDGLTIDVTNTLDAKYFQSSNGHLAFDRLRGRACKIGLDLLYTASPEWRTLYEAITSEAAQVAWTNTTHTVTLNFNGNNLVDGVDDDLTPGQVYMQKVSLETQWDTSVSSMVDFTFA